MCRPGAGEALSSLTRGPEMLGVDSEASRDIDDRSGVVRLRRILRGERLFVLGALAVVLIGAAFLRTWQLGQWPPGFNNDEAVNALDVQRIIAGWRPVFLPANNGREAGFMYLEALIGAYFGVTPMTMRLAAAVCGVATVAVTYGLAARWLGRWAGLFAAALLATAFWHVVLSRVGLRAIAVPIFYVAVFWACTEAIERRRLWLFGLAGILLGLSFYTYISARLLPLLLLIAMVLTFWRLQRLRLSTRKLWSGLGICYLLAALVATPEGLYFWHHPERFIGRTDQVMVFNPHPAIIGKAITFQQSLRRSFGMFWVAGDHNWLHNISGMTMLDYPETVLFVLGLVPIGIGVLFGYWQILRGKSLPSGSRQELVRCLGMTPGWPSLWVTGWMLTLLLGSSFTQESPNYLRLTAIMPAVCIVLAWGGVSTVRVVGGWRKQRRLSSGVRAGAIVLAAGLILFEGVRTYVLYFDRYAPSQGAYTAYDTDIKDAAAAAAKVTGVTPSETFIQLDAEAPFQFFRPVDDQAHWMREYSTVLPLPQPGEPGLWVYSHFQVIPPLPSYLPQARLVAHGVAGPGRPGYFVYEMRANQVRRYIDGFRRLTPAPTFGGMLQLVGVRGAIPATITPGQSFHVQLLWRVLQPGAVNFGVSLHVDDGHGVTWAQGDDQGTMRNSWHVGDLFASRYDVHIPRSVPPLALHVDVLASLLDPLHQPAAVLKPLGVAVPIGTMRVEETAAGDVTMLPHGHVVMPGLSVAADAPQPAAVKPGDSVRIMLHWLRQRTIPSLPVIVRAVGASGQVVAETTGSVGYGALPIDALPLGQPVDDPRFLSMPPLLATQTLRLQVVVGKHVVDVGQLVARDRPHVYTLPAVQYPRRDLFGGLLYLRGVDLSATIVRPAHALTVTLVWQDIRTPALDYKVFIHLLDAQGRIVAQNDSMPGNGGLPTRGWLPREVITDVHLIMIPVKLPPGGYHLELGLYDPRSGRRLLLGGLAHGDHIDLPVTITVK
ncbi:MAG: glycosyltransferase family 39 protein [Chloroflexi bacterium]|nr:glycosyltransferase family 39 protein [Chloroflexota bacterium]